MISRMLTVGLLCFLLCPAFVDAGNDSMVSDFYERFIGAEGADTGSGKAGAARGGKLSWVTAGRVAGLAGLTPEQVYAFIYDGTLRSEEGSILEACALEERAENAAGDPIISQVEIADCAEYLRGLWGEEHERVRMEFDHTQHATATARWWDGRLAGPDDYDALADLNVTDRQFRCAEALMYQGAQPSAAQREELSLAENDYYLPGMFDSGGMAFTSSAGCESGQVSLYGGLLCLPRFCGDFLCLDIKPRAGRRETNITRGEQESCVANIVDDLRTTAVRLDDAKQRTPTRNANQAHWFAQIFNWEQIWNANFTAVPRPIPIFDGLIPPDAEGAEKQAYNYGYNSDTGEFFLTAEGSAAGGGEDAGEGDGDAEGETGGDEPAAGGGAENPLQPYRLPQANPDIQATVDAIWEEEFAKVRGQMGVCAGDPACTSLELLENIERNCELYGSRSPYGEGEATLEACVDDHLSKGINNRMSDEDSRFAQVVETKQEFGEEMSKYTTAVAQQIEALLVTVNGVNECAIQQAQYSCGMPKINCARYGTGKIYGL